MFLGKWLDRLPAVIGTVYTLAVVFFGWILFRFQNFEIMWTALCGLFGLTGNYWTSFETTTLIKNYAFFLPAAIVCCTPLFAALSKRWHLASGKSRLAATGWSVAQLLWPLLLLLVSTVMLVGDSYNPFLYFQF